MLLSFNAYWDWLSFFLYAFVAYLVAFLIRKGNRLQHLPTAIIVNSLHPKWARKSVNQYYCLAFLILVLLGGLRHVDVGADAGSYYSDLLSATSLSISWKSVFKINTMEPFYSITWYLLRKITTSSVVLFLVTQFFQCYVLIWFFDVFLSERDSNIVFLPILSLFFIKYVYTFAAMRNGLSETFFLISVIKLKKRSILSATIFAIIACGFHYTALVGVMFLFFYGVCNSKFFLRRKKLLVLSIIVVLALTYLLQEKLGKVISNTKYGYYDGVRNSFIGQVPYIVCSIIVLSHFKRFLDNGCSNILFFGSIFSGLLIPIVLSTNGYRLPMYFAYFRIITYLDLIAFYKGSRGYSIIKKGIGIASFVWLFYELLSYSEVARLMPYKLFFQK